jgi:hypothetical protein
LYPYERSLVSHFENRPFALLGVNSDPSPETPRRLQEKGTVTWRSWWDGEPPAGGKGIAEQWEVRASPTLYLIDHKGVIRKRYVGPPGERALEKELNSLVEEAEAAGKSS